ncbi:MAG: nuclear transport factor 2 family protein [Anaerolineae bacterium]
MIIQRPARTGDRAEPSDVVLLSVEALNEGDVDAALARCADDVEYTLVGVSTGGPRTLKGQVQLRTWFEERTAEHLRVEVEILEMEEDVVTTETRTWCDSTRQLGVAPSVATERYLVREGKIQRAIRTIHPESAAKLQAALRHVRE